MRRLLVLSTTTGYQLRAFGDAAERLGVELAFATDRCHMLDDPWQDAAVPVRFHEEADSLAAIVRAAADRPIHGIVAVGDRPVVLAARAAEALGLRGNPPDAAAASANKLLARRRFEAAGLPVPWFFTVQATSDPRSVPAGVRYPCVVKPLGLSGSRGVIRANSERELADALRRVAALLARGDVRELRTGTEDELLIEGYIEGREYAVEAVLTDGRLQVLAIFDKPDPLDGPYFEETIYVTPSALNEGDRAALVAAVARAADALGLRHGPLHAECRVGPEGIHVLEVAARPIGGLCARVLRFTGQPPCPLPLEELLLRHALGEDVSAFERESAAAAVMMIPIPRGGRLRRVDGVEDARAVRGVEDVTITAKVDQLLEPLPEAGSYLGFIFARAGSPPDAERAVRKAHAALTFTIDAQLGILPAAR